MCEISVPLGSTMPPAPKHLLHTALYIFAELLHIVELLAKMHDSRTNFQKHPL